MKLGRTLLESLDFLGRTLEGPFEPNPHCTTIESLACYGLAMPSLFVEYVQYSYLLRIALQAHTTFHSSM